MFLNITTHAKIRFIQRGGTGDLEAELNQADPFGPRFQDCQLYRMPCGLFAVVKDHPNNCLSVVTVLTRDMALEHVRGRQHKPNWTPTNKTSRNQFRIRKRELKEVE